ncbi:MAG: class I adenylate-forming enzyme family protein [Halodesulfurarchaeum sp.]
MDEFLRRARSHHPNRIALIDAKSGSEWTYGELDAWAGRIGGGLIEEGATIGDRIGLHMARGPEAIATVWGIFRAGGIVVPLDPDEPAAEIRARGERADVEICVTGNGAAETFDSAGSEVREVGFEAIVSRSARRPGRTDALHPRTPLHIDRTRVILFTSGTTGRPTGVRLTGRNLGASAASTVERVGASPADRWLLDLPIHHAGGLSIPLRTAMLGATTVVRTEFDAVESSRTMAEFDVTGVSLVPTMLERLLDGPGMPEGLRFALVGGAATPPSLLTRALDAGMPIFSSYGMTETASGIATATPAELERNPESVGRPVRAATVAIRGDDNRQVDAGQRGEITVSGPIVSPGTIDGTERSPGEPLRTGDRGYLTPAGRLVVTGRIDDLIVTGGENVSPREVEAAIGSLEAVGAVTVLGLSDPEWGERIAAAIVPETEVEEEMMTAASIRNRLRDRLAPHKLPKTVRVVETLPRTPSGTIDREALRERLRSPNGH